MKDTLATALVKTSVRLRGRKSLRDLKKRAGFVQLEQERVLHRIIREQQTTEIGRHFDLQKVRNHEDFKRAVPIMDYELFRPWVQRQMAKGGRVINPEPPISYNVTSGTTGEPKYIPVRKSSLAWTREAQMLTAYGVMQQRPRVLDGKILAITSPACERYSIQGIPIGSKSGQVYQNVNPFIRSKYVVPCSMFSIDDCALKYLVILRLALKYPNITYMQTANTSTFMVLADLLNEHWDALVEDIAQGSFHRWDEVSPHVQRDLRPLLTAQPERAAELRAVRQSQSSTRVRRSARLRLKDVFTDVQAVGCWKSGSAGIFLKRLHAEFSPSTYIRDVGYLASELHGTTPIDGDGTAALPTFHQVYFEFVPRELWDSGERPAVETLGLQQLEEGRQYYVLATTTDGLLRYDMNDILEVVGFFGEVPRLQFVQKGAGVTNITGEKLSEYQVVRAVNRFEGEQQVRSAFFFMVADEQRGGYRLYYEPAEEHRTQIERFLRSYAGMLDKYLCDMNIEYAGKRESGRLCPLALATLRSGCFQAFRRDWISRGRREAQFKIIALQHRWELEFSFEEYVAQRWEYNEIDALELPKTGTFDTKESIIALAQSFEEK